MVIDKDLLHLICVMLATSLHFRLLELFLILVNIIRCFIVRDQMAFDHDYKLNLLALDFVHYLFNLYSHLERCYLSLEILWICYNLTVVSFCFKDLEILSAFFELMNFVTNSIMKKYLELCFFEGYLILLYILESIILNYFNFHTPVMHQAD